MRLTLAAGHHLKTLSLSWNSTNPLDGLVACRRDKTVSRYLCAQGLVCAGAVDPDAKAMSEGGLKLPHARELARLVFGEDLEALAGQGSSPAPGLPACTELYSAHTYNP